MALKLRRSGPGAFFVDRENRASLIAWSVISSRPPVCGIVGSGISLVSILGNCESRKSSSFCSSVIATTPLFPFTAGVVDKALGEVYFKAVQHLLWLSDGSSSRSPCKKFCQHNLFAFRRVV